ncbi:hypothetical protein NONO_c60140 [Nocardia nova SH22a]|uniref:Uncharacterized protein n=1 Tax=Nocardia nova SH22a TaxID=1415166 RepID=W5TN58_9NOCA|nr:hypothetical protein [Nocardia nova]AHH20790.1 hypothetical protein NONO_c60140 [Nocardia nova SH22a]
MPDQTPKPLTDEQLRRLTEYVHPDEDTDYVRAWLHSMARELLAARHELDELRARRADSWAAIDALGDDLAAARARIAELEAAQANRSENPNSSPPDAYIAVKRDHSVNAEDPEWCGDAAVVPAGDLFARTRDYHKKNGYQLLPIVADGDGTRAVTAQGEPVGYAVLSQAGADLWAVLPSAVLPESVAAERAANYRAESGRQTLVVELREVQS